MNSDYNQIHMYIAERENLYKQFREMYHRLDQVIIALYRPSQYTLREFEKLSSEYRILQFRADRLEEKIRRNYPTKDLNKVIAWMKSNPLDDMKDNDEPWNES